MANAIQRYAANKACCIAANVQKTDNKIKYGAEDMICCINKDFIANTFVELLMCNPVASDATWYKLTTSVKFVDEDPAAYTYGTDVTVSSFTVSSYNGLRSFTYELNSIYNWADNATMNQEVAEILKTSYNEGGSGEILLEYVYNSDTGVVDYTIYFTSAWGDTLNSPNFSSVGNLLGSTFDAEVTPSSITATSVNTDSCLTSSQLCDIKNWLDDYCQSC